MKQFVVLVVVFYIVSCSGFYIKENEEELHGYVLKRFTRDARSRISTYVGNEGTFFNLCDSNRKYREKEDLKESLAKVKTCLKEKTILSVSEEEYKEHVGKCTKDVRPKLKVCLNDNQQYYPDFLYDVEELMISIKYKYANGTYAEQFASCVTQMEESASSLGLFLRCVFNHEGDLKNAHEFKIIPASKDEFCRKIIPASDCYPETMKEVCNDTTAVRNYRKDFMNAVRTPCGWKEVQEEEI